MATRRLAAVAVLDVVGYSRLMAEDEDGTLATLKAHRSDGDPILLNHGGRIVKGTGDGLLAEFPSAVEAVRAAVELQQLMAQRNADLPPTRRMLFRIGINAGDVIVEDDGDIFGETVNVAARLEARAEPATICVSAGVRDQVAGRVPGAFVDLGPTRVKNIPHPVSAWLIHPQHDDSEGPSPGAIAVRSTFAPFGIAIMPLVSLSEDSEQDYFTDGIAEDLITALSRYPELRVVSGSSSRALRDRPSTRDIARELDVSYVVTGSVQRSGARVRVNAQLVDAETGQNLWAERLDRQIEDIFAVQDELVGEIAAHVHPQLERAEVRRRGSASPDELDAWDLTLQAVHLLSKFTPTAGREAIRLLELARDRDPDNPETLAKLAGAWSHIAFERWQIDDRNPFQEMITAAKRAYALDPTVPLTVGVMAMVEAIARHSDEAEQLGLRARQIAPHDALIATMVGHVYMLRGDSERAILLYNDAWRGARYESYRVHIAYGMALVHYMNHNYDAAAAWAQRGLETSDFLMLRVIAAASLAQSGHTTGAGVHVRHILERHPHATVDNLTRNTALMRPEDRSHYADGLQKAGIRATDEAPWATVAGNQS